MYHPQQCSNISSDDINFLTTNTTSEFATRWLNFCRVAYVNKCQIRDLEPNIDENITQAMFEVAAESDCFNTAQFLVYAFVILLSLLILIANGTVIIVMVTKKKYRSKTTISFASLAASDFMTGFTFVYSAIWNISILTSAHDLDTESMLNQVKIRANYFLCLIFDGPGLLFTCMMSSVLSLLLISIERYIAVFHTYRYPQMMSNKKQITAVIVIWIISLSVGMMPIFGWNNYRGECRLTDIMNFNYLILWTFICFLSAIIVFWIYVRIFIVAQKHVMQILSQTASSSSLSDSASSINNRTMNIECRNSITTNSTNSNQPNVRIKALKTTAMILGAFYICWMPFLVYLLSYRHSYENLTVYYLAIVTEINSLINPLLYGFRQRNVRKAFCEMVRCKR